MRLEKQLEFDFMKENWLTDVKHYAKKGLPCISYTARAVGILALSPLILGLVATAGIIEYVTDDDTASDYY